MLRKIILGLLTLISLSGCQIKTKEELIINSDLSITYTQSSFVDRKSFNIIENATKAMGVTLEAIMAIIEKQTEKMESIDDVLYANLIYDTSVDNTMEFVETRFELKLKNIESINKIKEILSKSKLNEKDINDIFEKYQIPEEYKKGLTENMEKDDLLINPNFQFKIENKNNNKYRITIKKYNDQKNLSPEDEKMIESFNQEVMKQEFIVSVLAPNITYSNMNISNSKNIAYLEMDYSELKNIRGIVDIDLSENKSISVH